MGKLPNGVYTNSKTQFSQEWTEYVKKVGSILNAKCYGFDDLAKTVTFIDDETKRHYTLPISVCNTIIKLGEK